MYEDLQKCIATPHLGLEPRTSRLEVLRSIQLSQQGFDGYFCDILTSHFVLVYNSTSYIAEMNSMQEPFLSIATFFTTMGYLERINQWKVSVNSACGQVEAEETLDQFEKEHDNLFTDTTDVGVDIELGFRGLLAELLKSPVKEVQYASDVIILTMYGSTVCL